MGVSEKAMFGEGSNLLRTVPVLRKQNPPLSAANFMLLRRLRATYAHAYDVRCTMSNAYPLRMRTWAAETPSKILPTPLARIPLDN